MLDFTKPAIARVSAVKDPDDRVEVCEDLDVVFEVVELGTFVGFTFCDGCPKRMLVFTVYTRGAMQFESTVVYVDFIDVLVVSDKFVGDDNRAGELEVSAVGSKYPTG